jgi:hypothetical protein
MAKYALLEFLWLYAIVRCMCGENQLYEPVDV